jgi:hypothetical protein
MWLSMIHSGYRPSALSLKRDGRLPDRECIIAGEDTMKRPAVSGPRSVRTEHYRIAVAPIHNRPNDSGLERGSVRV